MARAEIEGRAPCDDFRATERAIFERTRRIRPAVSVNVRSAIAAISATSDSPRARATLYSYSRGSKA